jgi:cyclophilin family peptidyl-prolyl cis-trans isomerase
MRLLLLLTALLAGPVTAADDDPTRLTFGTSMGEMVIELWPEEAPKTVEHFLEHVDRDHYAGLTFHRVIPDFMIQTGGYEPGLEYRDPIGTVVNESVGGPRNLRGTLAMARMRDPDSADAQFFVNLRDNPHLDADGDRPGYTVFGRVIEGMEVAERIAGVTTGVRGGMRDVPLEPVVIETIEPVDR